MENPSVDSIEDIEATNKRKADARMNPIICIFSPLSLDRVRRVSGKKDQQGKCCKGCTAALAMSFRQAVKVLPTDLMLSKSKASQTLFVHLENAAAFICYVRFHR